MPFAFITDAGSGCRFACCLLAACLALWPPSVGASTGATVERLAEPPGGPGAACPDAAGSPAFPARHPDRDSSRWWRIRVAEDLPANADPVLVIRVAFFGEVHARLPGAAGYRCRSPLPPGRDPTWPGRLAVFDAPAGLSAGDEVVVCIRQVTRAPPEVFVAPRGQARARALTQARTQAITEGTVLAMALAALGMSLALGSRTFLAITAGLAMALVYLTATNGSILEWPASARLARDWPMQRIGGIGATVMVGLGLGRFIELGERMPRVWNGFRVLLGIMALAWVVSVLPTPMRHVPIAAYTDALMIVIIVILFASALTGTVQGHRPSRLMLLSWTPLFVVAGWLALIASRVPLMTTVALQWLLPGTLVVACASLFVGLAGRFARVRAERDTATLLAETDELTGALSRLALGRLLERAWARARNEHSPLSVLFMDFDHFKRVNDAHGHAAGDLALRVAVDKIAANLRDRDQVGRYGGEEFIVALHDVSGEDAVAIAERIRADIENGGQPLHDDLPPMTISIGIATLDPDDPEPLHSLIARADQALLATKREGRNRVGLVPA
jgi:diguanylate cyclase (GGDEF)-like protein